MSAPRPRYRNPFLVFLLLLLFPFSLVFTQNNLLNNDRIYDFLERQQVLGRINYNIHIKPVSRQRVSGLLRSLYSFVGSLSYGEKAELDYWAAEYGVNMPRTHKGKFTFIGENNVGAYRFLEYRDSLFNITAYPDFGAAYGRNDKGGYKFLYYNGFSAYGSVGENFSFDLDFNDYSIKRRNFFMNWNFSSAKAPDYPRNNSYTKTFNWDRTRGDITYSWKWGYLSLRKDYNCWGTGYDSPLIFSDKAPSYPHIYLRLDPVKWLQFNYLHGELLSAVEDSSTLRNSGAIREHIETVPKYIAAHFLTIDFFENLKLSLGESVVYSDRFKPIYLIPVLFFRIADHYYSDSDANSGNAQIFSSISFRIPSLATRIDASVFIDEFAVSNFLGNDRPEMVGVNFGIFNYGFPVDDFSVKLEYTRINPVVYEHTDPAQTFRNRNYLLGHWIADNADRLYARASYYINARSDIKLGFSYIRKGDPFTLKNSTKVLKYNFLHGEVGYFTSFTINYAFEILDNLRFNTGILSNNSWGKSTFTDIEDHKYLEYSASLFYGFE